MRRRAFATAFALLLALGAARAAPGTASPPSARKTRATAASASQRGSIGAFFRRLDADGDGEIQTEELSAYVGSSVGGSDFDTEGEILAAVTEATAAIDGVDDGSSIDEEELLAHLTRVTNRLLTPHRVELWVRHGLRFPQYAEAFGANAITALDFPALIADGGAVLREDLGVRSAFHLGKIVRSLKRQILGLGAPPSPPRNVRAANQRHRGRGGVGPPLARGRAPRARLRRAEPVGGRPGVARRGGRRRRGGPRVRRRRRAERRRQVSSHRVGVARIERPIRRIRAPGADGPAAP